MRVMSGFLRRRGAGAPVPPTPVWATGEADVKVGLVIDSLSGRGGDGGTVAENYAPRPHFALRTSVISVAASFVACSTLFWPDRIACNMAVVVFFA